LRINFISFNSQLLKGVKMKVTIIFDNTVYKEGLQAEWGFSAILWL